MAEPKCKFLTNFGILNRYNENVLWLRIFLVWHLWVNSCQRSKMSAPLQQKCPCIIIIISSSLLRSDQLSVDFISNIQTSLHWSWLYSPQFLWHSWAHSCCWALMLIERCTAQPLKYKWRHWEIASGTLSGAHFLVTFEIKTIGVKNSRSQVNVILGKMSEGDMILTNI